MFARDTTDSWAYTTTSYREANGGSTLGTSRVGFVIGVAEDVVTARSVSYANVSGGAALLGTGIGLDNTTNAANITLPSTAVISAANASSTAFYNSIIAAGGHFLAWLEYGGANATFFGDGGSFYQNGLDATIMG